MYRGWFVSKERLRLRTVGKRLQASFAVVVLIATSLAVGVVLSPAAHAAPGQIGERSSEIVTADGLPTVQVDGVVWSQAIVGDTVYAGGSFANARPVGAAPGTNLTARANFLSYDLTTGALNTGFVANTNAQVLVVAKSPDGSRVYIQGPGIVGF